jgi:hypothetical protein
MEGFSTSYALITINFESLAGANSAKSSILLKCRRRGSSDVKRNEHRKVSSFALRGARRRKVHPYGCGFAEGASAGDRSLKGGRVGSANIRRPECLPYFSAALR